MTKVSIVIVTHNRHTLLPKAIASARTARQHVEIIVVDNASTADTAAVCQSLAGIVYVRTEQDQSLAGARNIGMLASTGEYISFLDDDDLRVEHSLDAQIQALDSNPGAGMVYGQALIADADSGATKRVYPCPCPQGDVFWQLLTRNFIPSGAGVFRRSCLTRVGLLDDSLDAIEDWDFWVRIAEVYPVIALEQPVMIWRQSTPGSGQMTSRADRIVSLSTRQFSNWLKLLRVAQASPKQRQATWERFSENMAAHLVFDTGRALARGKLVQAARDLGCLMRFHLGGIRNMIQSRRHRHSAQKITADAKQGKLNSINSL
jgi:glycosyltransferase involved in cell wall biosynthesis